MRRRALWPYSAGTLDLGTTSQTVGAVNITGAGTIQDGTLTGTSYTASNASGTATVNAVLAGSGVTLTQQGTGTLVLAGANTYTGGTTITSGVLEVASESNLGGANAVAGPGITLNGGELLTSATTRMNENVTLNATSTLAAATTTTATYNGTLANGAGYGSLTIGDGTNKGTVILTGSNSYYGGTSINGGTLLVKAAIPRARVRLTSTAVPRSVVAVRLIHPMLLAVPPSLLHPDLP